MSYATKRAKEPATRRFRAAWIDIRSICARQILLTAILLAVAVTAPFAAGASEAIIPNRALWPDTIISPAEFDRASRAEILVFAHQLAESDALNEGALKQRLGLKAVDIGSVERLRHRLWQRLTGNYVIASHSCVAGESFCAGDTDPNDLPEAAKAFFGAGIPPRYRPWFDDAVRFQRSYLDEQLRAAAEFPQHNSEVETFNDNELTGWDLPDRQFLLTFDDGPTHAPGDEAPDAGNTDRTLAVLRDVHINATFFTIGEPFAARLHESSNEAMQTLYTGMCVGSHGWVHESHAIMPRWQESVASSSKLIHDTLPQAYVSAFRPPYGQRPPDSGPYLKAHGERLILWNIDSHDWDDNLKVADVEQRVMSQMLLWRRGIILFHDFFPRAQKVVPHLVAWLAQDGVTWADCHAIDWSRRDP
jgi:peptidoglycan/xylan/chitin deacetylase (PgdA/CDA1 family)